MTPAYACVIEPVPAQLIGALMQRLSLPEVRPDAIWRLTIVDRGGRSLQLQRTALETGVEVRVAAPVDDNPFFNKWLFLKAWPELADACRVTCLDWDIVQVRPADLPVIPAGTLGCRRNPGDLYSVQLRRLHGLPECPWATADGMLRSSVNGGVIMADFSTLQQVADLTQRYLMHRQLRNAVPEAWAREQLALSLAVGDIGLLPLADPWNVTPLSRLAGQKAILWHYNDSHPATRELKSCLNNPDRVKFLCGKIPEEHQEAVARFLEFHQRVLQTGIQMSFQ